MKFSVALLLAAVCLAIVYAQDESSTDSSSEEVTTPSNFNVCLKQVRDCVASSTKKWFIHKDVSKIVEDCGKTLPECGPFVEDLVKIIKEKSLNFFDLIKLLIQRD